MKSRGLITAVLLSTLLLLTGCAVTGQPGSPTGSPVHSVTPSATPSDATTAVDPASYPLPAAELSQGSKGVMFTAGNGGLHCAIFDPLDDGTGSPVTVFGCEVSIAGFPYPAIPSGLSDNANAFISSNHEAAELAVVTDATYSGDTPAPALPAGSSITQGSVTCTALAADEVRCVDATSGHGMRVSARDYDLF